MSTKRLQQSWQFRPNNAVLQVDPSDNDVQNIYSFCENFNEFLSRFVYTCMELPKLVKLDEPPLLIDSEQNLCMMVEILNEQSFIFVDLLSQTRSSYKGYVSWLLLATHSRMYLIDAATLHDGCHKLKPALERRGLVKFTHECQEVLGGLKRDWGMFLPNIFDVQVIQRYYTKVGKPTGQPKLALRQFLHKNPTVISSRPLSATLLQERANYCTSEWRLLSSVYNFLANQDSQYYCYAYFNQFEFLLKSYLHPIPTLKQLNSAQKIRHDFESIGSMLDLSQAIGPSQSQLMEATYFCVKDQDEETIATMLLDWRQHIARIKDLAAEEVLPYFLLNLLAKTKISSVLQVSQICRSCHHLKPDFEQIFELLQLQKEQKQETRHEINVPRRLPYFKSNEEKPIRELFGQLGFGDVSSEWLNRKNDQSVRLYKEIVSIKEFDSSIIEEYLESSRESTEKTTGEVSQGLAARDVNRWVKYAQFLRLGNHKRLQELYDKSKCEKQEQSGKNRIKESQGYFEENFMEDEWAQTSDQNWEEIEAEMKLSSIETISQSTSHTSILSLPSFSSLDTISCTQFNEPRFLNHKKLNSLNLSKPPSLHTKIQPLPENIEAIYVEAAKAKKTYASKGHKKNPKTAKNQPKTKASETNSKKDQEFIPNKQDIFNLIYY